MSDILTMLERASVQGGIALLVVWLLCRLLYRLPANFRCWLWRLAFLKCLVGLFLVLTIAVPILPHTAVVAPSADTMPIISEPNFDRIPVAKPVESVSPAEVRPVAASEEILAPWRSFPFWLTTLYVVGVTAGMTRLLVSGVRTWRMTKRAEAIEHPVLPELAAQFGCRTVPQLARSSEVDSPLLAFNTILLPAEPTDDEPLMLGHELAHFRRRDLAWEWLGTITQIAFWFHPLVWLARREERMTREQAADALTIAVTAAPPADYARVLLAASLRRNGRIPTLAVGAIEGGSRLRVRLQALMHPGLPRRRAIALSGFAVALAVVAFVPWKAVARQQDTTSPSITAVGTRPMPPKLRARFIVRYPDGRPAPNVYVGLIPIPRRPSPRIFARTNDSGECTVQRPFYEPGTYEIEIMLRGDDYVGPVKKTIEISPNRTLGTTEITLIRAAYIIGQVTDTNGKPVQGIGLEGNEIYYSDETDSQGKYKMGVLPGTVAVALPFGYGSKTVTANVDRPTTLNFTVPPGISNVRGSIYDSKGNPVPVLFRIQNDRLTQLFSTQEPGQFYWQPPGYIPDTLTVFAYTKTEGAVFTVRPGQNQPFRVQLSPRKIGYVQFRVTDKANNPIRNAIITATTHATFDVTRKSDADGNYRVIVQPDVAHSLKIIVEGYHDQNVVAQSAGQKITVRSEVEKYGMRQKNSIQKITVRGGETRDLGHIVLTPSNAPLIDLRKTMPVRSNSGFKSVPPAKSHAEPPSLSWDGSVSGRATDSTKKPVANAKVSWVAFNDGKPMILAETTTNAQGEFAFTNVSNGPPEFATMLVSDYWRRHLSGWVMVQAKGFGLGIQRIHYDTRRVDVDMTAPKTYTVIFRDTKGKPVVGLPVRAVYTNQAFPLSLLGYKGMTDARGEFHAVGLPQFSAVAFTMDKTNWSISASKHGVNSIVSEGSTIITLDTGRSLTGTVRFPDGKPAPNVEVRALSFPISGRRPDAGSRTDAQGRYRLLGLGTGQYKVCLSSEKLLAAVPPHPETFTIPSEARTIRKDFTLSPPAHVVGRVTDLQGDPIAGIFVGDETAHSITDKDGRYGLRIAPGEASISVESRVQETVQARQDRSTTLNFSIPRSDYAMAHGQVVDSNNQPVSGVSVQIDSEHMHGSIVTDKEGKFIWRTPESKNTPLSVFVTRGTEGAFARIPPGDETPVRLQLSEKAVGHITGQVTDAAGNPITNVLIEVAADDTGTPGNPPVDAEGRFRIPMRENTPYSLMLSAPGYGRYRLPHSFDMDKPTTEALSEWTRHLYQVRPGESKDLGRIVLTKGTDTATGQIRDPENQLANQLRVTLITNDGTWEGKTNHAGEFRIPGVVQGKPAVLIVWNANPGRHPIWIRRDLTVGAMGTVALTDKDLLRAP